MTRLPPHIEALRDQALETTCIEWAAKRGWTLEKHGIDRAGPCPNCGGDDRFAIHTKKDTFHCRQCGLAGHGVIDLVMKMEGGTFIEACETITGTELRHSTGDAATQAKRVAKRQEDREKQAREENAWRENARKSAFRVWQSAARTPWSPGNAVADYLALRRVPVEAIMELAPGALSCIRQKFAHRWVEKGGDASAGSGWVTLHEGPAMIAAIVKPDGRFGAVHQTWIDLAAPKGKLVLPPTDDGKERPSKKVLGSKKGGAIRLATPRGARRIVMGEGIETTLTALVYAFEPDTAYWAGVDHGNMCGRALRDGDGRRIEDQPDMEDVTCFTAPEWCEELVYLDDGDGARLTAKLTRGLRRSIRLHRQAGRGLRALLAPAPAPRTDLNAVVMGEA